MNIGWVCIDGTNDWETVSTLGTCIDIRIAFFNRFLKNKRNKIYWFGVKKNSQTLEGKSISNLIPNKTLAAVRQAFLENRKKWANLPYREKRSVTSPTKWLAEHAMDSLWVSVDNGTLEMPECDVVVAEYMDTGVHYQVYFAFVLAYYAKRNVPLFVRDPERRFRYTTEFSILHKQPRENMYEHRLGRFVSQETVDLLRGKIRMIYPFKAEWDVNDFYRETPLEIAVMYDKGRDLPIPDSWESVKKHPVVMIGNDNNRRPFIEKWYGGLRYPSQIYGNWADRDIKYAEGFDKISDLVWFNDSVGQDEVLPTLQTGDATIYHLPPNSIRLGQITYRACEAPMAGTVNISPAVIPRADEFTLPEFIVNDVDELNECIENIMYMTNDQYTEAIEAQRNLVYGNFSADKIYNRFIKALRKDIK